MSFHAARVAPEKTPHHRPADRDFPVVQAVKVNAMQDQELRQAEADMWASIHANGDMLVDACGQKLGMPWAAPYIVAMPFGTDGETHIIEIDPAGAVRLAHGLIAAAATARRLTATAEAEYSAHTAISKAQDSAKEQ